MRGTRLARDQGRAGGSRVKGRMIDHEQANILMVDDQPAKLMTYEAILAPLGEKLLKARSAREALHHLLHHDVAGVLMDVSMPDLSWRT
jgi:CheY-like chemotaxis protein